MRDKLRGTLLLVLLDRHTDYLMQKLVLQTPYDNIFRIQRRYRAHKSYRHIQQNKENIFYYSVVADYVSRLHLAQIRHIHQRKLGRHDPENKFDYVKMYRKPKTAVYLKRPPPHPFRAFLRLIILHIRHLPS